MTDASRQDEAIGFIRRQTPLRPAIALILGSGLGDFADELSEPVTIPASSIPHYPASTVEGHIGQLVFGRIAEGTSRSLPILVFRGRVHYYESESLRSILFPIELARLLGARYLLSTNAAGGINRNFSPGDLMLIRDFIDLSFLRYQNRNTSAKTDADLPVHDQLADRFYFSRNVFDSRMQDIIRQCATQNGIKLQEGTYCWLRGPTYETPAEIEMLGRIGSDAVGMSTVPEINEAYRLGMKIAGISLISNLAAGITKEPLSHGEVTETASRVKADFTRLMRDVLFAIEDR